MIKQYEKLAKSLFSSKKYEECIKKCFTAMSLNPHQQWIYDLCGYSYLNIKMYSQSRGCFNTALKIEQNENKKKNYIKLIELCHEREHSSS